MTKLWSGVATNSFAYKNDLAILQGNINDQSYQEQILERVFAPHFDDQPVASYPIFMHDSSWLYRACAVRGLSAA